MPPNANKMLEPALDRLLGRLLAIPTGTWLPFWEFGSGRSPAAAMVLRLSVFETPFPSSSPTGGFAFRSRSCIFWSTANRSSMGSPMADCLSRRDLVDSAFNSSCLQLRVCRSLGMRSRDNSYEAIAQSTSGGGGTASGSVDALPSV